MISSEVTDEASLIGGVGAETEMFFSITWEGVRSASDIDDTIQMLISLVLKGFPESKKDLLSCSGTPVLGGTRPA